MIELVIVIAILAILAAIAIPVVNSIINTASKNAALSNADTIEFAIKECQAHIVSRNGEVYPEAASATNRNKIYVSTVAEKKGIKEAFEIITYNGKEYGPVWDKKNDRCVFLVRDASRIELESGEEYIVAEEDCPILSMMEETGEISISAESVINL